MGYFKEGRIMKILAIDPGTKCGWAYSDGENICSGVWNLTVKKTTWGTKWNNLFVELREFVEQNGVDLIVYEKVMAHAGTTAAHVYGGLIAVIEMYCDGEGIQWDSYHVGTIKKHATGKGNAKKEAMVQAARMTWPERDVIDHNEADALWLLDLAMERGRDP
jgi:Holliday junction resolvasome RuvABC endonuclease subunit